MVKTPFLQPSSLLRKILDRPFMAPLQGVLTVAHIAQLLQQGLFVGRSRAAEDGNSQAASASSRVLSYTIYYLLFVL